MRTPRCISKRVNDACGKETKPEERQAFEMLSVRVNPEMSTNHTVGEEGGRQNNQLRGYEHRPYFACFKRFSFFVESLIVMQGNKSRFPLLLGEERCSCYTPMDDEIRGECDNASGNAFLLHCTKSSARLIEGDTTTILTKKKIHLI